MCLNLFSGQIDIYFSEIQDAIINFNSSNVSHVIFFEFRIPRMLMAILAGSSLAVSGMFMQTLFNNPLAGPYVLGINSGSALFVALTLLTGIPFFNSDLGLISSAMLGAIFFGILILVFSIFVRSQISLLLIGLMISSFVGALISTLESMSSAEELKQFTFWSFGSLQQASLNQIPFIAAFVFIAFILSIFVLKPLNAMVLGENSAKNLGVQIQYLRFSIIGITAILTGTITAFCGPIAFVGLAIPNISRLLFRTQNHRILLSSNVLIGAIFMVNCDSIIQLLEPWFVFPINAFTSILGAPFVIYLILKKIV